MAFNKDDTVYACLRTRNPLPIDRLTDNRLYRDVISQEGQWSQNDTIKIKDNIFVFYGYNDASELNDKVIVLDENKQLSISIQGQGSHELTITLNEDSNASTLIICYRVGVPAIYIKELEDRKHQKLNKHEVATTQIFSWYDVFYKEHSLLGSEAKLGQKVVLDGMSIQTRS